METAAGRSRAVYQTHSRIQYDDYIYLSSRQTHGMQAMSTAALLTGGSTSSEMKMCSLYMNLQRQIEQDRFE